MQELIALNISGIICVTEGCDFQDDTVKVEDYIHYLNKPCEKCGGNILTQADYDFVQSLIRGREMFMNLSEEELSKALLNEDFDVIERIKYSVQLNGTGEKVVSIKVLDGGKSNEES